MAKELSQGVTQSRTDERTVIDIEAQGANPESLKVEFLNFKSESGEFDGYKVIASGKGEKFHADEVKENEEAALVASDKKSFSFKHEIPVREDYDISKTSWSYKNGIIRIVIPKFEAGLKVEVARS